MLQALQLWRTLRIITLDQGGGHIGIGTSSIMALRGGLVSKTYNASKAYMFLVLGGS